MDKMPSIAELARKINIVEESTSKKSLNSGSEDDGRGSLESFSTCKSVNMFTDQGGIEPV
jgi:hypothetical protein